MKRDVCLWLLLVFAFLSCTTFALAAELPAGKKMMVAKTGEVFFVPAGSRYASVEEGRAYLDSETDYQLDYRVVNVKRISPFYLQQIERSERAVRYKGGMKIIDKIHERDGKIIFDFGIVLLLLSVLFLLISIASFYWNSRFAFIFYPHLVAIMFSLLFLIHCPMIHAPVVIIASAFFALVVIFLALLAMLRYNMRLYYFLFALYFFPIGFSLFFYFQL